jgi:hypothetical protein
MTRSSGNETDFIATCEAGVIPVVSRSSQMDYPALVVETPEGLVQPLIPPVHAAVVGTVGGKRGLICGLDHYGFVCFYPDIGG